jgi:hypothetical protein
MNTHPGSNCSPTENNSITSSESGLISHDCLAQRHTGGTCRQEKPTRTDHCHCCKRKRQKSDPWKVYEAGQNISQYFALKNAERGKNRDYQNGSKRFTHYSQTVSVMAKI